MTRNKSSKIPNIFSCFAAPLSGNVEVEGGEGGAGFAGGSVGAGGSAGARSSVPFNLQVHSSCDQIYYRKPNCI